MSQPFSSIISSEEIAIHKNCAPVMTLEERLEAVMACKWVDEVVPYAPYTTSLEMMDENGCDICVHGDDISTNAEGLDSYHLVKAAGRFRTVPRTRGVSSTDIVGRMLLMTSDHHSNYDDDRTAKTVIPSDTLLNMSQPSVPRSPYTGVSQFLPTSRRIVQFSEGREPTEDDVIVYVNGTYDLFHIGHIRFLKKAKELGTYLIVGILPDNIVKQKKGGSGPIMNLHERVLSVLACRYVDEVIIGCPWEVTETLINSQRINIVVQGSVIDPAYSEHEDDPYGFPKSAGIYREIESPSDMTTTKILSRIIANRQGYIERNLKKEKKELQVLDQLEKREKKKKKAKIKINHNFLKTKSG